MALTGNMFLVRDGVRVAKDDVDLHPRTAIGIDRDTGQLLLLVIDGRQEISRGSTMKELAKLFQRLGAEDALNLDGGGSSIMLGRQLDGSLAVLNSPSDGHPRPVANGLEVTYDAVPRWLSRPADQPSRGQHQRHRGHRREALLLRARHLVGGDHQPGAASVTYTSVGASQPMATTAPYSACRPARRSSATASCDLRRHRRRSRTAR